LSQSKSYSNRLNLSRVAKASLLPWTTLTIRAGFNTSWHPNVVSSLIDGCSDHEEEEKDAVSVASGTFTDPGTNSLSRQLARRLKKSIKLRGGTNKQKATGMFRRKLPLLLCKSVKDNAIEPCLSTRAPTLFDMAVASASEPLPPVGAQMTETTARSESPTTTHMYNASLFQGKTLTSNTLDLLCGSHHVEQSSIIGSSERQYRHGAKMATFHCTGSYRCQAWSRICTRNAVRK
jgi:hypothetical protein